MQHYSEIKHISICEFLPPHIAIYVDLPAEEVQKRLKQSGKVTRHSPKTTDPVIPVGYCDPVKTLHSLINFHQRLSLSSSVGTSEQRNTSE